VAHTLAQIAQKEDAEDQKDIWSMSRSEGILIGVAMSALAFGLYSMLSSRRSESRKKPRPSAEQFDGYSVPPLPEAIVNLLKSSRLCFLATQADGEPHISLMNFTYHQDEEVIIMCTRRNTKKFDQMSCSSSVAILIHDFPHLNEQASSSQTHGKTYSVTLNGVSQALPENSADEAKYRSIHLQRNPDYSQFIEGNAVILVKVDCARSCDIKDRVQFWQK